MSDTKKIVDDRDADIARLQNNARIADENSRSKDQTVEEMRKTLEGWKSGNSPETRSSSAIQKPSTQVDEIQESLSEHWPNVQNFRPALYKRDFERRLYKVAADRRLAEPGIGVDVEIHFTIEKDGRPSDVLLVTPVEDEETKKRCLRYIEAAGPFRPLLSSNLEKLNVNAQLSQSPDAFVGSPYTQVQISSLQIEALGNKL